MADSDTARLGRAIALLRVVIREQNAAVHPAVRAAAFRLALGFNLFWIRRRGQTSGVPALVATPPVASLLLEFAGTSLSAVVRLCWALLRLALATSAGSLPRYVSPVRQIANRCAHPRLWP